MRINKRENRDRTQDRRRVKIAFIAGTVVIVAVVAAAALPFTDLNDPQSVVVDNIGGV